MTNTETGRPPKAPPRQPPMEPRELLDLVLAAEPGWSQQFGGPEGVAQLTKELQENVKRQAEALAMLRTAALVEMLRTRSLTDVAASLGVSKQAVSKASRGQTWGDLSW